MSDEIVYNPLDKIHLAESIVREFFKRKLHPLPPIQPFTGAGIYALYYHGNYLLYHEIADSLTRYLRKPSDSAKQQPIPVYIGKSDPPGSRKGVLDDDADEVETAEVLQSNKPAHRKLFERLRKHSKSILATTNLRIEHFQCRYMLVDEIWVALGEAKLVDWFKPLWNVLIEGFGSNVEGGGRGSTARSVWDILHPGRKEDLGLQVAVERDVELLRRLREASTKNELRTAIREHAEAKRQFARLRKKIAAKSSN